MAPPIVALLLALAAASMTMFGWVTAVIRPSWRPRTSGWMLLVAAVAMLAVSIFELLPAALSAGLGLALAGMWAVAGFFVVLLMRTIAHRLEFGSSALERSAMVIAAAIAIHNIPEGAAPYAAALISLQSGIVTAIGLGLHNIAEGLAIATPVMAGGGTRRRAFWLVVVATVGEMGGALIAFSLTSGIDTRVAGGMLAFVAGVMITVSTVELGPACARLLRSTPDAPAQRPEQALSR